MFFNILFKQINWMITKSQDPVLVPLMPLNALKIFEATLSHISAKFSTSVQAHTGAQLEEAAPSGT